MNPNQIDSFILEILLIEDSAEDLELTLRALRRANLANNIRIARDGEEALNLIFNEGPDAERSARLLPKLILLDLKLPKIDGLQVLRRLKSDPLTRSIPVVVLTSSKEHRDVSECYDLGVNSFVVKPVGFLDFSKAVQDLGMYWILLNQPPTP